MVKSKFGNHRPAMEMLSGGQEKLTNSIPKMSGGGQVEGSEGAKKELRGLMGEVRLHTFFKT